jgi:hypothetical protein
MGEALPSLLFNRLWTAYTASRSIAFDAILALHLFTAVQKTYTASNVTIDLLAAMFKSFCSFNFSSSSFDIFLQRIYDGCEGNASVQDTVTVKANLSYQRTSIESKQ